MAKIGNLKAKVGTYMKDGAEKGKYVDVGVLMSGNDGGYYVLMNTTFNPAGVPNPDNKEAIMISVFEDNQGQNGGYGGNNQNQGQHQQNQGYGNNNQQQQGGNGQQQNYGQGQQGQF